MEPGLLPWVRPPRPVAMPMVWIPVPRTIRARFAGGLLIAASHVVRGETYRRAGCLGVFLPGAQGRVRAHDATSGPGREPASGTAGSISVGCASHSGTAATSSAATASTASPMISPAAAAGGPSLPVGSAALA